MSDSIKDSEPVLNELIQAGQISRHIQSWSKLTSDAWVLNCGQGYEISFLLKPIQHRIPIPLKLTSNEITFVDSEIKLLLEKGVLEKVNPVQGQWLSNIFLRPKRNGKFRMILDLTSLNKLIEYRHFKMFNLITALELLTVR